MRSDKKDRQNTEFLERGLRLRGDRVPAPGRSREEDGSVLSADPSEPGLSGQRQVRSGGLQSVRDAQAARRVRDALIKEIDMLEYDMRCISPKTVSYQKRKERVSVLYIKLEAL